MTNYLFIFLASLLTALANFFAKMGASKLAIGDKGIIMKLAFSPYIIGSVFLFAGSFLFYSYALMRFNLSIAYPIQVSVAFVLVMLLSALYFKEHIGVWQLVAFGFIIFGVWLLASGK